MSAEAQAPATDPSAPGTGRALLPMVGQEGPSSSFSFSPAAALLPSPSTSQSSRPASGSSSPIDDLAGEALLGLVTHGSTFAPMDPVEDTRKAMQRLHVSFAAVVDGGEVVGLLSAKHLGEVLGTRFGFAIYERRPVRDLMQTEFLRVCVHRPLTETLLAVSSRDIGGFYDEVILEDADGKFLGLIPVHALMHLQTHLLQSKLDELAATSRALAAARDAALDAAKAKADFLANMSHEIRTPMNGVIGMTSLMSQTRLDAEQHDLLNTIQLSSQSLLKVLNDILDFSKIESGQLQFEQQPVNLEHTLLNCLHLFADQAAKKNLDLVYRLEPGVPEIVSGDVTRLQQILVNLVGNAIKFTARGDVSIRVRRLPAETGSLRLPPPPPLSSGRNTRSGLLGRSGRRETAGGDSRPPLPGHDTESAREGQKRAEPPPPHGGGYAGPEALAAVPELPVPEVVVRFEVHDTGIGIPPEKQHLLFQPFSQVDSSTARRFGGTGLGLAITRRLIHLLGGRIGVTSEAGHGATFWFELPARVLQEAAPTLPRAALAGRHVLLADDNATCRRVLREIFESWGARPTEVAGLAELLALGPALRGFDYILLDSEFDGSATTELIARLRAVCGDILPRTALLSHFGCQTAGGRNQLATLGVAAALPKPVSAHSLLRWLEGINASAAGEVAPLTAPSASPAADKSDLPSLRLLVAEDNLVNQKVITKLLEKLGCRTDVVMDGAQAVAAIERGHYDVVFMDVQMPEMDGYEATRLIRRRLPAERQPWIVALTANSLSGDWEKCLEAGMDEFLSKPVTLNSVALALKHATAQAARAAAPTEPIPFKLAE
jgi:signal transduction histidine kinase/DNA-binding response OmpR family regulator